MALTESPPAARLSKAGWAARSFAVRLVSQLLLIVASIVALLPLLALARGAADAVRLNLSGPQILGTLLSLVALLLGAVFFAYSVRYYSATLLTLLSSLLLSNGNGHASSNGHPHGLMRFLRRRNGNGHLNGNGNGNGHSDIGYEPFVSIHIATYNEKRVINRLLEGCAALDYKNYEVVLVDDSTDESETILESWRDRPRFKIVHRRDRDGFKGGALQVALQHMDPRSEFVIVWDADVVPFPDSIQTFLPYFFKPNGNGNGLDAKHAPEPRTNVAAVQSYQWHVLNKSESWLTSAVRAEYAGSYMVERPFQESIGSLKMVAGTTYMIRASLLREFGWGRSLTEDWELSLRLYALGYKVVYTPYAESPAECVATFARLSRQRMRWAEGHSYNVRRWFVTMMCSPNLTLTEKIEFLYYSTYYMQAALFIAGSAAWLVSELFLHAHVPEWTALLGWSLLLTNLLALPLMNTAGLMLEGAPARDFVGVLGALVTSFLLTPFQAYAAVKGFLERDEGPWYRTPKTGRITDPVKHLRRLAWVRRWLFGNRGRALPTPGLHPASSRAPRRAPARWAWIAVGAMFVAVFATAMGALRAPVVESSSGSQFWLHGALTLPTFFSPTNPSVTPQEIIFANPCVPACPSVWQGADASGGPAVATTGAQTVFAGSYGFDYWTDLVPTGFNSVISWTFEYGDNAGCTLNPVVIAQNNSFTLLDNHVGGTAVNVVTTGSNTAVPTGKFFCLRLAWVSGGPTHLTYNNDAGLAPRPTNFTTPSVIFIPEFGVALVGLALLAPLVPRVRRRKA
ncbi:MAG: glycosyltransferase family 2 protein [Chloroflexi bacterium]|nr:MAG: glycosyltransferase family 2 protein [Chloroflexota bacterium]